MSRDFSPAFETSPSRRDKQSSPTSTFWMDNRISPSDMRSRSSPMRDRESSRKRGSPSSSLSPHRRYYRTSPRKLHGRRSTSTEMQSTSRRDRRGSPMRDRESSSRRESRSVSRQSSPRRARQSGSSSPYQRTYRISPRKLHGRRSPRRDIRVERNEIRNTTRRDRHSSPRRARESSQSRRDARTNFVRADGQRSPSVRR